MTARYRVQIDWDADGDFDQTAESLDRDVLAVRWALGLADSADSVAAPSWAEVTLRDPTRRYTPEYGSGPLYGDLVPRKKVRITSTYGGVERVHFTGWIERIAPDADRTTVIHCTGVEALLQRAEVFVPLGLDQTADAVIAAVLAQVAYPPAISGYWLLGTARLGLDTRLPDTTTYSDLEPGRTAFAYVGDWGDGVTAWDAIRAVTEAERGWCLVDRAGRVVFWNRHHLIYTTTVSAALTTRQAEFAVVYDGADLVNRAVITCHPRQVGSGPEALWTLETPLEVPPGGSRTVRARFAADSGARIGGLDLITPVGGTDYHANGKPDGSGTDCTASVSVAMVAAAGSAALTFTNGTALTVHVLAGAQVRGTRVADWGAADVEREDATSITLYGRRTLGLNLPLIADPVEAGRLARALVVENHEPRGRVRAVTLRGETSADVLAALLSLTMGDRITLTDSHTGHAGDYYLVGERHALRRGGLDHETTWVLRPASPLAYWRLGVSGAGELGTATRLVY